MLWTEITILNFRDDSPLHAAGDRKSAVRAPTDDR